jgi:serine/threonine-protein kinase
MSDVFISYKAEDRQKAQPLVQALQADGYSVWWDEHIGTGDEWRRTIEHQLDSARCVVVIWTKRSAGPDGHFVRDEASRAQRRHVYVPILFDAIDPPLGFGESQAASLRGWKGDRSDPRYQAVLAAVQRIAGAGSGTASAPAAGHPSVSRRSVLAGSGVAVVAVAGVGAWELFRPSSASASGSIAVLPFSNLSGDPNQTYFSDGLAEEIRTSLARIAGLKVAGSTSSDAVRHDDAQTAAKKLSVANILTGSVRQSPSTIRVSAELIDGRTGMDRWSQDYDRSPGDAIKIQTDIAEKVATALSSALGVAARAAVSVGGTQNPEAQRLYMQVLALTKGPPSKEAFQQGLQMLDSAIALDPNYADAYASKAGLLVAYGNNYANGAEALAQNRADALRTAQMALQFAPNLPAAHRALFSLYSSNLEIGRAYSEILRARELAPGDSNILTAYGVFTGQELAQPEKSVALLDQAIAMDPLNPAQQRERLYQLFLARRYADAVSYGKQLLSASPQFGNAIDVGHSLVMLGRFQEAQSYYDQAPADYWGRMEGEAVLQARQGNRAAAEATLAAFQQAFSDAGSTQYGEIYGQLGEKDKAFAALDRAFEIKDGGLLGLRVHPFLDPLRSDPRFSALLAKMNFPA